MLTTVNDNTPQSINVSLHSLQTEIDNLQKMLDSVVKSLEGTTNYVLGEVGNIVYPVTSVNNQTGDVILTYDDVGAVPLTRTVNGKALGNDIVLDPSDVSAVPITRTVNRKALSSNITLTASDVGAVPITRTVNGKALSSNITLTASDVGALANTYTAPVTSVNSKTGAVSLTASDVSALSSSTTHLSGDVPTTRKVNGKALSSDITLAASDVGAEATIPTSGTTTSLSIYKADKVSSTTLKVNKYGRFCHLTGAVKCSEAFSLSSIFKGLPSSIYPPDNTEIFGFDLNGNVAHIYITPNGYIDSTYPYGKANTDYTFDCWYISKS